MRRKLSPIALVLRLPSEVAQDYGDGSVRPPSPTGFKTNVSALDLVGTKVI